MLEEERPLADNFGVRELRDLYLRSLTGDSGNRNLFGSFLSSEGGENVAKSEASRPYSEALLNMVREDMTQMHKAQPLNKVIEDFVAMFKFEVFMHSLRLAWTPQCGKGSQADYLAPYKLLNTAENKIIRAKRKEQVRQEREWRDL